MSAYSSPYREIGLKPEHVLRPKRKVNRHAVVEFKGQLFGGVNGTRVPRWRHRFALPPVPRGAAPTPPVCDYCKQPKFAVDGAPCRGKR